MTSDIAPIRFGSVCSGIEAASVAMEPLGWQPAWFAEIEAFPSAVLAHHWPHVQNLGDMTTIAARILTGEIEAPDVLVGGTPCQAFSVAGLRGGLSDHRGQLTLSYVELANAIDSRRSVLGQQPCVTWWENVPGVLSSKDNAFGCFLAALAGESFELQPPGGKWADAGCVFGPQRAVAWRVLDAQYFGLAQRRRRVFVVSSARDGFNPAEVLFEFDGVRRDTPPSREASAHIAGTLDASLGRGRGAGTSVAALTANGVGTCGADDNQAQAGHLLPDVICMAHGQGGAEIASERSPTLTCNHEAPIAAYSSNGAGSFAAGIGPLRARPQDSHENLAVMSVHGTQVPDVRAECDPTWWRCGACGNIYQDKMEDGCECGECDNRVNATPAEVDSCCSGDVWNYNGNKPALLEGSYFCHVCGEFFKDKHATGVGGLAPAECPRCGEEKAVDRAEDVPQYALGTNPIAFSCKDYGADATEDLAPTMRAMGHDGSHANAGGQLAVCITGDVTHTLKAEGFDASEDGTGRGQPIVPTYAVRTAQTSSNGWGVNDSTAYTLDQAQGQAVATAIAFTTEQTPKSNDDCALTLTKQSPTGGGQIQSVMYGMAVRRLTPVECERLQGFPDNWTLVPVRGKPAADGPRYKALGNSMAVNCMRWIGRRIDFALRQQPD